MSKPDKATTERFTRILREMLRHPENKTCADCKRNDPRWASWNIGVFVCIRCSGIHRGMGTHISKVKSVDLDVWTPEQMESIQKWGNRRANLYWEAHLKAGHVPPDHKMESFIRSKYESRRWAMNGPPPSDPSILENGAESTQHTPTEASPPASRRSTSVPTTARTVAPVHRIQPQPHRLISTGLRNQTAPALALAAPVPAAPAAVPSAANELFSLDFHSPPQSAATPESQQQQPQQDVKNNILSLFSTPSPIPPAGFGGASVGGAFGGSTSSTFGQFGAAAVQSQTASPWATATSAQPLQQTTSMMGSNGTGMWGASSGWTMPQSMQQQQPNVWSMNGAAAVQQQQGLFESSSIWSSVASAPATTSAPDPFGSFSTAQAAAAVTTSKQDDTFGDLWGGFK